MASTRSAQLVNGRIVHYPVTEMSLDPNRRARREVRKDLPCFTREYAENLARSLERDPTPRPRTELHGRA